MSLMNSNWIIKCPLRLSRSVVTGHRPLEMSPCTLSLVHPSVSLNDPYSHPISSQHISSRAGSSPLFRIIALNAIIWLPDVMGDLSHKVHRVKQVVPYTAALLDAILAPVGWINVLLSSPNGRGVRVYDIGTFVNFSVRCGAFCGAFRRRTIFQ